MKTYLINYAHKAFFESRKKNSQSAKEIGEFDEVIEYTFDDIDDNFRTHNAQILSHPRGAGYWIWKPYIVNKTLARVNDGDIVFYCDSGSVFIKSAKPLIDLCINKSNGVVCFHMEPVARNKEVLQTKKDTFVLMGCDYPMFTESWARLGGFSVWQKNAFSLEVAAKWLQHVQDPRVVTDMPNQCGVPEDPRFIDHRHDQSVFSLITKKYNIRSYTDPSQFGNDYRLPTDGYDQIIDLTRDRR